MKLKELNIELQPSYAQQPGKYIGKIEYEGERGTTVLVLDPELSEKVLAFIGPVITAAALKVSKKLEADLQQSITEAQRPLVTDISSA